MRMLSPAIAANNANFSSHSLSYTPLLISVTILDIFSDIVINDVFSESKVNIALCQIGAQRKFFHTHYVKSSDKIDLASEKSRLSKAGWPQNSTADKVSVYIGIVI